MNGARCSVDRNRDMTVVLWLQTSECERRMRTDVLFPGGEDIGIKRGVFLLRKACSWFPGV